MTTLERNTMNDLVAYKYLALLMLTAAQVEEQIQDAAELLTEKSTEKDFINYYQLQFEADNLDREIKKHCKKHGIKRKAVRLSIN